MDDALLAWLVRTARDDHGLTVAQACKQIRENAGKGPTAMQLKRRYERIATAYPDRFTDYIPADPRRRIMTKVLGVKTRGGPGMAMLTAAPVRKPSKY